MADSPQNDGYDSLINEGIDELNASHNFESTSLKTETKERKFPLPPTEKLVLGLLGVLVILNAAAYLYFSSSSSSELTAEKADAEVLEAFDDEAQILEALKPLMNAATTKTISKEKLQESQSTLDSLGVSMPPESEFKEYREGFWAENL